MYFLSMFFSPRAQPDSPGIACSTLATTLIQALQIMCPLSCFSDNFSRWKVHRSKRLPMSVLVCYFSLSSLSKSQPLRPFRRVLKDNVLLLQARSQVQSKNYYSISNHVASVRAQCVCVWGGDHKYKYKSPQLNKSPLQFLKLMSFKQCLIVQSAYLFTIFLQLLPNILFTQILQIMTSIIIQQNNTCYYTNSIDEE